jgi:uncharacterized protein YegJ (DUF2314 family)
MKQLYFAVALSVLAGVAAAQLAPNAPTDQPQPISDTQVTAFQKAIQPFVTQARATYPDAKKRFLAGLPQGQVFFVTTNLRDAEGRFEQVFIRVTSIKNGTLEGVISSQIQLLKSYSPGQHYSFAESEILDWLISKPDGSEEGNVVGKFLDTYRP